MFHRCVLVGAILFLLAAGTVAAQPTTVHVSPVAGDPVASGTALLNALAGITDGSWAKPYVLKLDPGTYNLGPTMLVMKPYVDIEGSGQGSTTIIGPGNNDSSYHTAIVQAAAFAELRNVQVASQGQSAQAASVGIYIPSSAGYAVLRDVTVVASGAQGTYGIRNVGTNPTLEDVTITVAGDGLHSFGFHSSAVFAFPTLRRVVINNTGSSYYATGIYSDGISAPLEMRNLEISVNTTGYANYGIYIDSYGSSSASYLLTDSLVTASGASSASFGVLLTLSNGTFNVSGTTIKAAAAPFSWGAYLLSGAYGMSFNRCEVSGASNSIVSSGAGHIDVGSTHLVGSVSGTTFRCAGAYNANYAPLNSTCQ
jgi:hypothetical protein